MNGVSKPTSNNVSLGLDDYNDVFGVPLLTSCHVYHVLQSGSCQFSQLGKSLLAQLGLKKYNKHINFVLHNLYRFLENRPFYEYIDAGMSKISFLLFVAKHSHTHYKCTHF